MTIPIPAGVEVKINGSSVHVKGPRGQLEYTFTAHVDFEQKGNEIFVTRNADDKLSRSLHGTSRAVLSNMVVGVSTGFQRVLEVNGVGYRAEMSGSNLMLYVGYSHPVEVVPPAGISFETEARTRQVKVLGYDKQQVGQIAANIREIRPPEPYQGKGIKYIEEKIRRKAGKTGKG
jgi:large subunit ribosomal protein L6